MGIYTSLLAPGRVHQDVIFVYINIYIYINIKEHKYIQIIHLESLNMYILNFNLLVTESKIKILDVTIPPIFRKKYRRRRETLRNNANIVKYNKHSIRTIQTPMARHRRRLAHGWSCTTLHIYIYILYTNKTFSSRRPLPHVGPSVPTMHPMQGLCAGAHQ